MRLSLDGVGRAEVLGLLGAAVRERPHLRDDPDAAPILECLKGGRAEVRAYVRHGRGFADPPPVSEWGVFDVYVTRGPAGRPVLRVVVISGPRLSRSSVLRITAFCGLSGSPRRRREATAAPALLTASPEVVPRVGPFKAGG